MSKPVSKTHVIFDEDTAEYLQDLAGRTGWSINRLANHLIRSIQSVEIATAIDLKESALIHVPGKQPVQFRRRVRLHIRR